MGIPQCADELIPKAQSHHPVNHIVLHQATKGSHDPYVTKRSGYKIQTENRTPLYKSITSTLIKLLFFPHKHVH